MLSSEALLERYNFYIVPMVNPDGVFLGNHRTGVLGQDLNRQFQNINQELFPEVDLVTKFVSHVQKKHKVAFLMDMHGHSSKRNIFAFGEEQEIGSHQYLLARVLPKLLSQNLSSFKYEDCAFKESKEKKNTARVYFSKRHGINSLTFEQSYGLLDIGCIGVEHWSNFGRALSHSLLQFS